MVYSLRRLRHSQESWRRLLDCEACLASGSWFVRYDGRVVATLGETGFPF